MAHIYQRLSWRHLGRGWSIYWRIALPFWVQLAYFTAALAFIFDSEWSLMDYYVGRFAPGLSDRPEIPNAVVAVVLYLLGLPLVRRANAWLSLRYECSFFRSQFAIFAPLDKFNRALACLYAFFIVLMLPQWAYFLRHLPHFWLWLAFLAAVIVGVVSVSAAFYGWLDEQFQDESKELTP